MSKQDQFEHKQERLRNTIRRVVGLPPHLEADDERLIAELRVFLASDTPRAKRVKRKIFARHGAKPNAPAHHAGFYLGAYLAKTQKLLAK